MEETVGESAGGVMIKVFEILGMEDYAMEGGNVWKPKHGRIECARDEVMKEVQKQASEINATRETDVRTLRRMLRWLRPARDQDTVDVAKELVRILPKKARRRYWRILKGMVERNTYPQEWNEWIAMLAMKPGEDPTDLGRRRDLWLQCHSMKCLFRMIPVQILKGLGQGDLASPARAKQLLTVIAGAVDKARWEQWTWRGRTCSNVTLAQYTNARAVR